LKKVHWLALITAACVVVIDQTAKYLVVSSLPLGGRWSPLPGPAPLIQIIHTANTGAALGLFKDFNPVFIVVAGLISLIIVIYARQLRADQRLMALALGLLLGGSLGNLIDRLRFGYVIDYFDIGLGALRNASNFADWCIVLGVILLALTMLRDERRQRRKTPAANDVKA